MVEMGYQFTVLGDNFVADKRISLISVTGSTYVGKRVAGIVGEHKGSVAREILISLEDWDEMQLLEADEDSDLQ